MKLKNIDQRLLQSIFLQSLFLYAWFYLKIPHITLWYVLTIFVSIETFQYYFSNFFKIPYDFKSAMISGTSIIVLLSTDSWQVAVFCTFFTIASKFLIRANGKHIFNPNNFGIILTIIMFPTLAKITPYQWGLDSTSLAFLVAAWGVFVTLSVKRCDIALFFYFGHMASMLLFSYTNLFSGNLFLYMISIPITLFSFFMITDPRVTPNTFIGRFIFAGVCVFLTDLIYIFTSLSPSFMFALPFVGLLTPVIDKHFGGQNFEWNKRVAVGNSI